jgi:DNA-binding CsgD family transcriptional regulator
MGPLRVSDLEGALRFVHEASVETGPEPFPVHVLEGLRSLLGCEWASYCELDRRQQRHVALIECPVPCDLLPGQQEILWRITDQHPLCRAQMRGRVDALKLSDFSSRRELRRLEVYADWFRPLGIEFELEVTLRAPVGYSRTFLFDDGRRDFGERERALLNLLQPHLLQLHRAAAVRRVAQSACALLEDGRDLGERGVLVVDARGAIEVASPQARRLLDEYAADGDRDRLPAALARWLEEQQTAARAGRTPTTLSLDGPPGTLLIDLARRGATDVVLLEEHTAPDNGVAALSTREREVLELVRDGLRNAEIAEVLWVSPATVRKHLENIYEKLDVHTRTAAVARVHGAG